MKEITTISFPGLGIGEFNINKIAFTLFNKVEVRWYGILITFGIILAFIYAIWRGKRSEKIIMDDILDIGIVTVILGVIGARAYYVLTTLDEFKYDSFLDVIATWNGGLAIYGGIIGGCLGILITCYVKRLDWRKLFDLIAPGVMLAQAIGRWGNFCNGEAYGSVIGSSTQFSFLNMNFAVESGEGTLFNALRMGLKPNIISGNTVFYFHPTFLYESVWNLLGFVLINLFYKHKKYDGQIAILYFTWYGFGRMFIEGLRTDSLYLYPGSDLRISQCLGLLFFVLGVILLISLSSLKKHEFMTVKENASVNVLPVALPKQTPEEQEAHEEADKKLADALLTRFADKMAERMTEKQEKAETSESAETPEVTEVSEPVEVNEESKECEGTETTEVAEARKETESDTEKQNGTTD